MKPTEPLSDVLRWVDSAPDVPAAAVALVRPDEAARLLTRNTKNRPVAKTKLAIYAQNMTDGRFPLTSSAVAFDADGAVQNGQHRLQACVASGVPFPCVVVKGLDPASFLFEDVHIKRSLSDMLCILKEPNYKILASALSNLARYLNQVRAAEGERRRSAVPGVGPKHQMLPTIAQHSAASTIYEHLQVLDGHPKIRESVAFVAGGHKNTALIPQGMQAALHYLGSRVDAAVTEEFLLALLNGVSRSDDLPVVHLIRALQSASVSNRSMKTDRKYAYCLKALRLTLQGRKVSCLKLQRRTRAVLSDGSTKAVDAEEFPLLEHLGEEDDAPPGPPAPPPARAGDPRPVDPTPEEIARRTREIQLRNLDQARRKKRTSA